MPENELDMVVVATTAFAGGGEKYIANLYAALSKRNYRVALMGSLRSWSPQIGPVLQIASGPKWSLRTLLPGVLRLPAERSRLRATLARVRVGAFHLHFKREQIGFTSLLRRAAHVVWTEHGRFPKGLFGALIKPAYRWAARRASCIVCVSDYVREEIQAIVGDACRVETIPSAVDTSLFKPMDAAQRALERAKRGLGPDVPVALYLGRLDPGKRPGLAIESALAAGVPILVAGEGSESSRLRERFAGAPVTFLGPVSAPWELYPLADVHLFTSNGQGEGFPTVLLESAAAGLPTVATVDSGFGRETEAASGVAVGPTVHELSEAIKRVLTGAGPQCSRRARDWALQRDYSLLVDQYTQVLRSADRGSRDDSRAS
jgi:glycosyltransferase involved in cell wall biosynthesis